MLHNALSPSIEPVDAKRPMRTVHSYFPCILAGDAKSSCVESSRKLRPRLDRPLLRCASPSLQSPVRYCMHYTRNHCFQITLRMLYISSARTEACPTSLAYVASEFRLAAKSQQGYGPQILYGCKLGIVDSCLPRNQAGAQPCATCTVYALCFVIKEQAVLRAYAKR